MNDGAHQADDPVSALDDAGELGAGWFERGLGYAQALDGPGNFARAFECLQRAARAGHDRASAELDILRRRGPESWDGLLFLAQQGDAAAQHQLADAYAKGEKAPRDPDQASYWLNRAAESGDIDALFALGVGHAADAGSTDAFIRAYECFDRAAAGGHERAALEIDILRQKALERVDALRYLAARGDAAAILALARRFMRGEGVPRDAAEAMALLLRAVAREDAKDEARTGLFELGLILAGALDGPGSFARAFECFQRAAQAGHDRASAELDILRRRGPESWDGLLFLAQQGDAAAQHQLADAYAKGEKAPRDPDQAAYWLNRAAESGDVDALFALGVGHAADLGPIDAYIRAYECFERAALGGHARAATELGIIRRLGMERLDALHDLAARGDAAATLALARRYMRGEGVPRDAAEAMALLLRAVAREDAKDEARTDLFELGLTLAGALEVPGNFARAFECLQRAAQAGHERASAELDILRSHGSESWDGLLFLAEQGDAAAQHQLADAYVKGEKTPRDPDKAAYWLNRAAESGDLDALFALGVGHAADASSTEAYIRAYECFDRAAAGGHERAALEVRILRQKALERVDALRYLAQRGDAAAELALARRYMRGEGVPRDAAEAMALLLRAVAREDAKDEARTDLFELGLTLAGALEVPGNFARAFECLQKAAQAGHERASAELDILRGHGSESWDGLLFLAEQGDAAAQHQLADAYAKGEKTPRDPERAAYWLNRAAESGDLDALFALGVGHAADASSTEAYIRAYECFDRAAAGGHERAALEVRILRQKALERVDALRYLAERGDAAAQLALAKRHAQGDGLILDTAEAMTWLRRAAEAGDCSAQYHLGLAFATGAGTVRDVVTGRVWLERAASGGSGDARHELTAGTVLDDAITRADAGQPESVAVAGEGAFATRFASILRRHGVAVRNEIGDGTTPPAALFVTDGFSFTPTGQVLCDFPVYLGALQKAVGRSPGVPIRHPAFALTLSGLKQKRSVSAFGLPGAGNTIFMRVVEELQREAGSALTTEEAFFQRLAELHVEFLAYAVLEFVPALKQNTLFPSNQRIGRVDLTCVPRTKRSGTIDRIFGLPCVNHATLFVVCHGFDEAGLERLDGHGFTTLLIARNPLDTIHSLINKYRQPFGPIVGDYEAFELLVRGVTAYLARLAACAGRYTTLRYERLLTDFESVTEGLAAELDLPCDRELAQRLKSSLLLKSLVPNDPLHFRGGQQGAWRRVFDRRHFEILQRHGLPDVMEALGYPRSTSDQFEADIVPPTAVEPRNSLRMDLHFLHHLIDVPFPEFAGLGYDRVEGTGVGFQFEDAALRERLKDALQSPLGRALLSLVE